MVLYAVVGPPQFSRFGAGLLCILGMQGPSNDTDIGSLCLMRDLTATSKVTLLALLQLSVGVAMAITYTLVTVCPCLACCRTPRTPTSPLPLAQSFRTSSPRRQSTCGDAVTAQPVHHDRPRMPIEAVVLQVAQNAAAGSSSLPQIDSDTPARPNAPETDGNSPGASAPPAAPSKTGPSSTEGATAPSAPDDSTEAVNCGEADAADGCADDATLVVVGDDGSPERPLAPPPTGRPAMSIASGALRSRRAPRFRRLEAVRAAFQVDSERVFEPVRSSPELAPAANSGGFLSQRAMLVSAAMNFSLTAYATLTAAAVKMLHCVWVPGTPPSQRRLYIRGSVVCDYGGWQAGYLILVALLVAAPLGVGLLSSWAKNATRSGTPSLLLDVRLGLQRSLVLTYKESVYWWEGLLMVQRLVGHVYSALRLTHLDCTLVDLALCCGDRRSTIALLRFAFKFIPKADYILAALWHG